MLVFISGRVDSSNPTETQISSQWLLSVEAYIAQGCSYRSHAVQAERELRGKLSTSRSTCLSSPFLACRMRYADVERIGRYATHGLGGMPAF